MIHNGNFDSKQEIKHIKKYNFLINKYKLYLLSVFFTFLESSIEDKFLKRWKKMTFH